MPRTTRLMREAHEHVKERPDVRAIVVDGNCSSIRSRCSCINQDLEKGEDALRGGVDHPDVIFYHRFCLNTPARKDPHGRCADCAKLGRVPATKDVRPGGPETSVLLREHYWFE